MIVPVSCRLRSRQVEVQFPSPADILVVVIYLLPGFISFQIIRKIYFLENEIKDLEFMIWSVFGSICIHTYLSFVTGLTIFELVSTNVYNPRYLMIMLALSVSIGLIGGNVGRAIFRPGNLPGNCFEYALGQVSERGSYVMIYTTDGREFKGMLRYYDSGGRGNQVIIENPKIVIRDESWKKKYEIPLGYRLLFLNESIREIVFLNAHQ